MQEREHHRRHQAERSKAEVVVAQFGKMESSDGEGRVAEFKEAYGNLIDTFSANGRRAMRAARDIRAGTVTVNCYGEGDLTTPFGGYKQSGFGGRDNGVHAHDQYTELKTIWIDLSDPADGDSVE